MNGSQSIGSQSSHDRLFGRALAVFAVVASSVAMFSPAPAGAAAQNYRIDLKVLVLDDDSSWVAAIKSQMQVEGVPFNSVSISSVNLTQSFLVDSADANHAKYQAIVVPDHKLTGLTGQEPTILRNYETKFGIRQVDAWENDINSYGAIGLGASTFDGELEGATANVTDAGKAAGFGYLNGPVPFSIGSYTHIAPPLAAPTPPGATLTTIVQSAPPGGGTTGTILGVYSSGGVEQMVITSGFASTFPQFQYLGHGIITWMTRGVHLGYNRNSFTMHVDDAFAPDSLWDPALNCTPGEDCTGTETTARMSADDVAYAVAWMQANQYELTMAFNGFYATNAPSDPLTQAFVANQSAFRWLNHGYEHIYQGCQQNTSLTPWICNTPPQPLWVTVPVILNEINANIAKGHQLGLTFDEHEYLSGEHSGLQYTSTAHPGQNQGDNPNFATALNQVNMVAIGSDASREATSRVIGDATNTIPRHPTALYYNAATQAQAVDEYNWLYTSAADGGSGLCGTTTPPCISPLGADGFTSHIVPTDASFDLGFILSNDPRPFYAHTTNMVGDLSNANDRLLYHLLDAILGTYRSVFTDATPVKNLTLTEAAKQLVYQQQWATDSNAVTGYVKDGVVSITNPTSHAVPFTAPAGTTIAFNTLESYGGESSAWLAPAPTYTGTLPAPVLTTTGGVFPVNQGSTITFFVPSTPTATVSVSSSPPLPAGLTYTQTPGGASITGTPAPGAEKIYTLSVSVVTAGYNNVETATLTVPKAPVITSGSSATAVAGNPFSFTVTTTGIPAAAITSTGTLPSGIILTDLGNGTATLAGTPALASGGQSFPITLSATNVGGAAIPQNFMLVVDRKPEFTSANSAAAVATAPFLFTITAAGTPAPAITMSGGLPSGVTFNALGNGTASLSGTAPMSVVGHSYPIALTATSSAGVANQNFTLTVTRVPQFTSPASTVATTGSPFTFAVGAVGAPMPAITMSGTLPSGVTFTDHGNGSATLSGTPGKASAGHSFPLSLTATNTYGSTVQTFMVHVEAATSLMSVTPARLADTRPGFATVDDAFAGGGIRPAGSTLEVIVAGRGGVPSDASAVVLNVTVAEPVGSGFVTVYPCGSDQPLASNLNFTAGAVVPNAVIAELGIDGKVCLFVSNATQLVVDVNGYFPSTSTFSSMNPARTLDTRPGHTTVDGQQQGEGMRPPGTVTVLNVTGRAAVPADAAAVVLNVTVTEAAGPGHVTVYPCGASIPTASNINFTRGSTVANLVLAKIGAGGNVCIYNYESVQLVVDVNGYFPGDNSYQPLDPARLLETRPGLATIEGRFAGANLLPAGTVTELTVTGRGSVPTNASTVVLNVTVTEPTASGFVTAYPCGIDLPLASNLNYFVDTTVAIAVIVKVGSNGKVCLFNSGPTQLIADVNGYLLS